MVALYQACRGLVNRDCNAAIAGGVNVIGGPDVRLSTIVIGTMGRLPNYSL